VSEYYNNGAWHSSFPDTSPENTNRPSPWEPLTSFYDFNQKVQHVFYIGETANPKAQHLFELYYNGKWRRTDLTANGAPVPAGNSGSGGLMSYTDGTLEHVFYTTNNGNLIEMTHQAAGGLWTNSNVPAPSEATALTGFNDGIFQHVFYLGSDGRVQEMYRAGSNGPWQTNNLTVLTNAPPSVCGVTSFFDGRVEHVFYVGRDSHVHEIYYDRRWFHNDLTRVTAGEGTPNAQSCSEPNGNSQ
jgi:hypothetical protein